MSDAGFTRHGGRLSHARAIYPDAAEPWIDLSTGINPEPWPGAAEMATDWRALPDPAALAALEAVAARHFGVDPALCCAVPGSEIGLRLLGRVIDLPGVHLAPAYRTHAEICPEARTADLPACPPGECLLLLANPNNPDGRVVAPGDLGEWLARQERCGGWLAVDEAFADATPGMAMAHRVADGRRLIVLRSFGKFFGLAGLRLGFVLAPRPVVARFRRLLGDWPLSAAALAIGAAAYADTGWIEATRVRLAGRARRLDELLRAHGLAPVGDCPLFRLVETPAAGALFERLAGHAILTRPFADHPRRLRLGLPADDIALARLDRALADG